MIHLNDYCCKIEETAREWNEKEKKLQIKIAIENKGIWYKNKEDKQDRDRKPAGFIRHSDLLNSFLLETDTVWEFESLHVVVDIDNGEYGQMSDEKFHCTMRTVLD